MLSESPQLDAGETDDEPEHPDDVPTECDWDGCLGGSVGDGPESVEGEVGEGSELLRHCLKECPVLGRLRLGESLAEFLRLMTAGDQHGNDMGAGPGQGAPRSQDTGISQQQELTAEDAVDVPGDQASNEDNTLGRAETEEVQEEPFHPEVGCFA